MRASDRRYYLALGVVGLLLHGIAPEAAAQGSDQEKRLRDQLRQAVIQLRALEDERAALVAQKAESDCARKALEEEKAAQQGGAQALRGQLETATQELAVARAGRQQAVAESQAALAASRETLAKWQAAYQDAANVARAKEGERAKLEAELGATSQRVGVCEAKNKELLDLGKELLDAYDRKDVADVLLAKEPLTGIGRVELETMLQDFKDRLTDQRVEPSHR